MNYRCLLIAVLGITAFSACISNEKRILGKIEKSIHEYFENLAFKSGESLEVYEVSNLTYRIVSHNTLDSARIGAIGANADVYYSKAKTALELMKLHTEQIALYQYLGNKVLIDGAKNDAFEQKAMYQKYMDTLKMYQASDSVIRMRISSGGAPDESIYKTRFLLKLKIGPAQMLDTVVMYLNEGFQPIELGKI